jgi:hypothetical protein
MMSAGNLAFWSEDPNSTLELVRKKICNRVCAMVKALGKARFAERKAMINRKHDLAIAKQAQVLRISRGSVYYLRGAYRSPWRRRSV